MPTSHCAVGLDPTPHLERPVTASTASLGVDFRFHPNLDMAGRREAEPGAHHDEHHLRSLNTICTLQLAHDLVTYDRRVPHIAPASRMTIRCGEERTTHVWFLHTVLILSFCHPSLLLTCPQILVPFPNFHVPRNRQICPETLPAPRSPKQAVLNAEYS